MLTYQSGALPGSAAYADTFDKGRLMTIALRTSTIMAWHHSSAPPRRLDGGDVDLRHLHHRVEGTLCFTAASSKRVGEHARGDLPGEAPAVLAPTAGTFLAAIADNRVPVAVRLFLIVCRDLEG